MSSSLPMSFRSIGGSKYPPRKQPNPRALPSGRNLDAYEAMKANLTSKQRAAALSGMNSARSSASNSGEKKQKMLKILERNNSIAERKKQQAIVLQKLTVKFGASNDKATKSALANTIKKMVELFFKDLGIKPLSAPIMNELEAKVKSACDMVPSEVAAYRRDFERQGRPRSNPVPSLDLDDAKSKGKANLALPENIDNDWSALTIANAIEYEEGKKREKVDDRRKKAMQREKFDKQKAELDERRRIEKENQRLEQQRMSEDYDKYLEEEAERQAREDKRHNELRKMYSDQMEERRVQKEKEKLRQKIEAEKEAARLARELKSSRDKAARIKSEEKRRYQGMVSESAANEALRQRRKEKTAEEDKKMMAEHKARLDREDAKRAKALEDRMSRYEAIGNDWATSGAGAKKAEAERKMMEMVNREAKKKDDRDDERIRRDREKLVADKVMMKKLNSQLMEEKRARDEAQAASEMKFARDLISRTNREIDSEKAKSDSRRQEALAYKAKLVGQMEADKLQAVREATTLAVSETERLMNRDIFGRLHGDRELIGKINERYDTEAARTQRTQREGGGVAGLMRHENMGGGRGRGGRRKGGSPNKRAGGNRRVVSKRK
ncbi:hypothetical protein TrRE_jg12679 [Triparma retinervis]|uniref:Uncharacterized protein n=1 Tax=Triparma retinervis TaxID=2557542 RepID=A0A9W7AFY0_9STRA|nr:hypothetical protein TrRE_jg12679 [Triparma retinervis]